MAYTALYRKWRPVCFEDVKGQDPIVRTLKNQITSGRIGHAYLFCGTRGTGKTTIAKIFAKAVNCQHPVNGSPCNECAVCRSIASGASMNVVEIDAASNNGVDNIREIRDEVKYSPTEGNYRVYIIDEVHMLSTGAFNALLKTLEEPPSYVIFILATTEVHKIPITVLSRCQRYDFRRINNDVIAAQIEYLLREENVEAEPAAIRYVAKTADGSMRDALSLLEQCISFYYGQKLTYENVLDVLGAVDTGVFSQLLREIIEKDVTGCIHLMDEIVAQGRDLGQFITDFTWYMRNLLLVQTSEHAQDALDMSAESLRLLKEEAQMMDIDTLMRYIRICSELSSNIRYASSKRVLIELAFIKLMRPAMESDLESLKERIQDLEARIESGVIAVAQKQTSSRTDRDLKEPSEPEEVIELTEAEYEDYKQLNTDWNKIIGQQKSLVRGILRGTRLSYDKSKGLCILFADSFSEKMMNEQDRMDGLKQWLQQTYGKTFTICTKCLDSSQTQPQIVRGNRIPGIEMEIGIEE
ncbi:DNA polymerase III subunit tau [Clostridiales bacterium CHKCI001]|nr:DNA polymerase III subunit tau [Clostridiales bacterium CHKCI001]